MLSLIKKYEWLKKRKKLKRKRGSKKCTLRSKLRGRNNISFNDVLIDIFALKLITTQKKKAFIVKAQKGTNLLQGN